MFKDFHSSAPFL